MGYSLFEVFQPIVTSLLEIKTEIVRKYSNLFIKINMQDQP